VADAQRTYLGRRLPVPESRARARCLRPNLFDSCCTSATGSGDSSPATTPLARRSDTSAATMCRITRPHIFLATPNPSEAGRVRVAASVDVLNIDFSLVRVRTAAIKGTTLASNGEPFQGGVRMRPSRRSGVGLDPVGGRTFPDGRFEFPNVAPGEHRCPSRAPQSTRSWSPSPR
jgi:hypothetical protein